MRTLLALLALAGLLLAAAPASAQASQYALVLSLVPPVEVLTEDGWIQVTGKVDFTGDPTTYLNLNGVPVEYKITALPAWASAVVSPSTDIIHLDGPHGPTATGSRTFTLRIDAGQAPPSTEIGIAEITATVYPTAPGSYPKSVSAQVPLQYFVPEAEEECDDHLTATAILLPPEEDEVVAAPAEDSDEITVQSGGVTPVGTWYAVGAFGLAGGIGGFVMLRRRGLA